MKIDEQTFAALRERKRQLDDELTALIRSFECDTGLRIASTDIIYTTTWTGDKMVDRGTRVTANIEPIRL